ncbi:MAG: hypothetical protein AAF628_15385 [Planctomycetota bacterium]
MQGESKAGRRRGVAFPLMAVLATGALLAQRQLPLDLLGKPPAPEPQPGIFT